MADVHRVCITGLAFNTCLRSAALDKETSSRAAFALGSACQLPSAPWGGGAGGNTWRPLKLDGVGSDGNCNGGSSSPGEKPGRPKPCDRLAARCVSCIGALRPSSRPCCLALRERCIR